MNGTVKFYNRTKEFGFIAGEDDKEYFMHSSAIEDGYTPDEEDKVTFEAGESDRGPRAANVKKAADSGEEPEGLAALDE
jgi:CspA family cold shock protein